MSMLASFAAYYQQPISIYQIDNILHCHVDVTINMSHPDSILIGEE